MLQVMRNQLKGEKNGDKCLDNCIFRGYGCVFVLILLCGHAICGACDELEVETLPVGFEVSVNEREKVLVSKNNVFAFGFFNGDDGLEVGIWYNLGSKTANVLVWTAGPRVTGNYTLKLSMDGSLIVFDNYYDMVVWSSDTSHLGVERATLMDNGNLVLKGKQDRVIWESFSSATDTLLPGQSLRYPDFLRAASKDSLVSDYTLEIRHSGEIALVWMGNAAYWSSDLTSVGVIKEAKLETNGVFGLYDGFGKAVWVRYSDDFDRGMVLRYLRLDADGNLRVYSWDSDLRLWRVGWKAVASQCTVFGFCGFYSVCGYRAGRPTCGCLSDGDIDWNESPECKKIIDVQNCESGIEISTLRHTVFYDIDPADVQLRLNEDDCGEYCLNDSSCVAATSLNDGSGLCKLMRTNFISAYQDATVSSAVSFQKFCLLPLAVATGQTGQKVPAYQGLSQRRNWKKLIESVAIPFAVSVFVFLTIQMLVIVVIYRRRKLKAQSKTPFGKDDQMNSHYSALIRLSFEEVKEVTTNFRDHLGPSVFRGVLPNQTQVAVKILDSVVASEKEFRMVVTTLGGTHHRNLVQLKGFCFEPMHKIILYEHIPSGSLDKWLFKSKQDRKGVYWQQKLDIVCGVARALAYLHTECQQCIAHGNLRLKNVLLDENLVAKVTDFGLQSLLQKDSASSSESLPQKDIYMFGQMVLQILMGQHDIVGYSPQRLIHDMYHDKESGDGGEWEGIERACRIALWCMHDRPFLRPSIEEVVKVLEGTLSVDKPPPSLAFNREDRVDNVDSDENEIKVVS